MNDFDIVQRLMDHAQTMEEGMPFNDGDFVDLIHAADVITQLRAEISQMKDKTNEEA